MIYDGLNKSKQMLTEVKLRVLMTLRIFMVIVYQQDCNRHIVATGANEKHNVSIGEI